MGSSVRWHILDSKTRAILGTITAPDRATALRQVASFAPAGGSGVGVQSVASYEAARGDKQLPPYDSRRAMAVMERSGGRPKAQSESASGERTMCDGDGCERLVAVPIGARGRGHLCLRCREAGQ